MPRKRKSSLKFRKNHPREVNKFYRISDKNNGHPGQVFFCDVDNDTYLVIKFTQSNNKDRVALKHNIDPLSNKPQYAHVRPFKLKYDDMEYTSKYLSFRIHKDDLPILEKIKNRRPK